MKFNGAGTMNCLTFNYYMELMGCPVRASVQEATDVVRDRFRAWCNGSWTRSREILKKEFDAAVASLAAANAEIEKLKEACAYHYSDFMREREIAAKYAQWLTEEQELLKRANEECDRLRRAIRPAEELEAEISKLKGLPA